MDSLLKGVTAVIFVAGISEFDQVLFEDNSTERMTESSQLLETLLRRTHRLESGL